MMNALVDFTGGRNSVRKIHICLYRLTSGKATCVQVLFHVRSLAGSSSSGHCDPGNCMLSRAVSVRFPSPSPGMQHIVIIIIISGY
jgi:hypothetical protein